MIDQDCNNDGFHQLADRQCEEDESGRIVLTKNRVLVGCTGSVASMLLPRLLEELSSLKYQV
jgi:hypothetical protein